MKRDKTKEDGVSHPTTKHCHQFQNRQNYDNNYLHSQGHPIEGYTTPWGCQLTCQYLEFGTKKYIWWVIKHDKTKKNRVYHFETKHYRRSHHWQIHNSHHLHFQGYPLKGYTSLLGASFCVSISNLAPRSLSLSQVYPERWPERSTCWCLVVVVLNRFRVGRPRWRPYNENVLHLEARFEEDSKRMLG